MEQTLRVPYFLSRWQTNRRAIALPSTAEILNQLHVLGIRKLLCVGYWMIRGHGAYVAAVRQIRESYDIEW
jgi:hypothetical protein